MEQHSLENDRLRLSWNERAAPGTPVVFLSGGPGVPNYLADVAALLPDRRVVTYDQRGTGDSRALDGDYSWAAHVNDLEQLRFALGAEQLALFGHSWGGMLAQLYACEHPQRVERLFACNPSTGVGADWAKMEKAVVNWNMKCCSLVEFLAIGMNSVLAMIPGRTGKRALERIFSQVWLNYQQSRQKSELDSRMLAGIGRDATMKTKASVCQLPEDKLEVGLASVSYPFRMVYGARDIYGDLIEGTRKRLPRVEFEVWQEVGHLPWIDDPIRFQRSLQSFFG